MLNILDREDLSSHAADVGAQLTGELAQGVAALGLEAVVGDVRGRGLTIGIDIVDAGDLGRRAPHRARKAAYRAWQLGAVVFYVGGNVLEVTPPLTLSEREAHEGASILLQAIAEADTVTDEEIAPFAGW